MDQKILQKLSALGPIFALTYSAAQAPRATRGKSNSSAAQNMVGVTMRVRPAAPRCSRLAVVECAVASGCRYIVTHNVKDFKPAPALKVHAITPADFLTLLKE